MNDINQLRLNLPCNSTQSACNQLQHNPISKIPLKEQPTLKDIADACGLTVATVSRCLRGNFAHSAETRKRVRETAKKLHYRPDPALTALVSRRKNATRFRSVIAYVYTYANERLHIENAPTRETFRGARERAAQLGYGMETFCATSAQEQQKLRRIFLARGITGVICEFATSSELNLDWSHHAAVVIGHNSGGLALNRIHTSHYDILMLARSKLLDHGYRRIGLVITSGLRESSAFRMMAAYQLKLPSSSSLPVFTMPKRADAVEKELRKWFDKVRPDAVICPREEYIDLFKKFGIEIPRQLGFVSVQISEDDSIFSGVMVHNQNLGKTALDLLHSQLVANETGMPERPLNVIHPVEWNQGTTVRSVK
jgi:LacI family transcriptional regulator